MLIVWTSVERNVTRARPRLKIVMGRADQSLMRKQIDPSPTAKVVIGSIGVLYGTVRLLTALVNGLGPSGGSAYQTGQIFGLALAAATLYFGGRYALRGLAERKGPRPGAGASKPARPAEVVPGSTPPPRS